jgi:ketosteroid isomerase-like protein
MAQENLEALQGALDAAPANPEPLFAILADDVEWDYVGAFPESQTYRGPDAVRGFFQQWSGAFDEFGMEVEDMIDAGESVVVLLHQWGRGKDTGVPVENRTWQVFDFRAGKIVHCAGYEAKADALAAARRSHG